jgi:prolyl-tRNA editing enzyme YbaK/EbsC (Cys-tRNA(Pro) deacylase)
MEEKYPVTLAVRELIARQVDFTHHVYAYVEKGGTQASSSELGVKTIGPCQPEMANKHSGYQVGGTSPFGTRKKMPIYLEKSILELDRIYINGGKRG